MRTAYAVWEITLACNLSCIHCGSRAGSKRSNELNTDEALDLVRQLVDAGITEVTLIGGEAFLRPDWLAIADAITKAGMACTMTTGGYGISAATANRMKHAGIHQASVSIDGLEQTHDRLRGRIGSFRAGIETIAHFRNAGIVPTSNTQINRLSAPELPALFDLLKEAGIKAWQIQLTVPMGNAADHSEILLQPCELPEVYDMLAQLAPRIHSAGVRLFPGNNIGYHSPYDSILQWNQIWNGCPAGLSSIGIEADGTIKACPSLPTDDYAAGNIRDRTLHDVAVNSPLMNINMGQGTAAGVSHLWGFCATCEHAATCRGGCHWTAHVFFDKRGNNPYCHHRALKLRERGLRERVVLREKAPGIPFDNGRFAIIEEPVDAPWPAVDPLRLKSSNLVGS